MTFLWHDYETLNSLLETTVLVGNSLMEEMVSRKESRLDMKQA